MALVEGVRRSSLQPQPEPLLLRPPRPRPDIPSPSMAETEDGDRQPEQKASLFLNPTTTSALPKRVTIDDKCGPQAPLKQWLVFGSQEGLSHLHLAQYTGELHNSLPTQLSYFLDWFASLTLIFCRVHCAAILSTISGKRLPCLIIKICHAVSSSVVCFKDTVHKREDLKRRGKSQPGPNP